MRVHSIDYTSLGWFVYSTRNPLSGRTDVVGAVVMYVRMHISSCKSVREKFAEAC